MFVRRMDFKFLLWSCALVISLDAEYIKKATAEMLSCGENRMTITLTKETFGSFERIETIAFSGTTHPSCRVDLGNTSNYANDSVVFDVSFSECGIEIHNTESHMLHNQSLIVTYKNVSHSPLITRLEDERLWFVCNMSKMVSKDFHLNVYGGKNFSKVGMANFDVNLDRYSNATFNKIDYSEKVQIGEPMYFQLKLITQRNDIHMSPQDCYATPNKQYGSRYNLIMNRCKNPDDMTVKILSDVAEKHVFQWQVESFLFFGQKNEIFIRCDVWICHISSKDEKCRRCDNNNTKLKYSREGNVNGTTLDVNGTTHDVNGTTVDVNWTTVNGTTLDVNGTTLDVNGTTLDVNGTTLDVNGTTLDVNGTTLDVNGTTLDVNWTTVNGTTLDVNGTTLNINGTTLDINGTTPDINWTTVNGTTLDVNGTTLDVNGTTLEVNGTTLDINGTTPDINWTTVNGTTLDVNGTTLDVNGTTLDVNGTTLDVNGTTLDVNGTTLDVNGTTLDVNGTTLDVNGTTLDVNGTMLDVNGTMLDVNGTTLDVNGTTLDVNGTTSSRNKTQKNYQINARKRRDAIDDEIDDSLVSFSVQSARIVLVDGNSFDAAPGQESEEDSYTFSGVKGTIILVLLALLCLLLFLAVIKRFILTPTLPMATLESQSTIPMDILVRGVDNSTTQKDFP